MASERRRRSWGTRLSVAATLAVSAPFARALPIVPSAVPDHYVDASLLADGMVRQGNASNAYSYALPPTISWGQQGAAYANKSDCSSFVSALLMHSYGLSSAHIQTLAGTTRATGTIKSWPQSATWYTAVTNGTTGTAIPPVAKVADVRLGDLIFIKYADGDGTGDTGHCMLVADAPRLMSASSAPVVAGASPRSVRVIDVTGSPHTADTRDGANAAADGTDASGVGYGTVRVWANADGTVNGHSWGTSSASVYRSATARPLVFARPDAAALRAVAAGGAVRPAARVFGRVRAGASPAVRPH